MEFGAELADESADGKIDVLRTGLAAVGAIVVALNASLGISDGLFSILGFAGNVARHGRGGRG